MSVKLKYDKQHSSFAFNFNLRRYRKEIFEGYEYNVDITQFTDRIFLNMVGMDVFWFYPESVSEAWAETKEIIKAQAVDVLQAQPPGAGQLAVRDQDAESDYDGYDDGYDYDDNDRYNARNY
jgi:hypothetical protein